MAVQDYLTSTYGRQARVRNSRSLTGVQVARQILDDHGLCGVRVEAVPGALSDHHDPAPKVVRLSGDNCACPA